MRPSDARSCRNGGDMARARNLGEFEAALQRLHIPMFMVIYADRNGHIVNLFNGRVPGCSNGDHHLPASVSLLQLPDGVSGIAQRIGPVDDRHDSGGLDELLQNNQITCVRRRKQRAQSLADEPRQYKRSH